MEIVKVKDLIPHPRNKEFFDDITGDNWELFLESVRQNGVITPIVISSDLTIISGNQRVRACLELEIEDILARIKIYKKDAIRNLSIEDVILEELILTNLRQRGIGNPNMIKMSRCAEELKRINDNAPRGAKKTNQDLASDMGVSRNTFKRYLNIAQTIPEIQDLIQDGKISSEVARNIFSKMSEEEQEKMLDIVGKDKLQTMSTKDIKNVVEIVNDNKKSTIDTIREIIKIVPPEDYLQIKEYADEAKKDLKKKDGELLNITKELQQMKESERGLGKLEDRRKKLEREIIEDTRKLNDINKLYGDATNTLKKQKQLNDLIDQLKDTIKLVESKFIGFIPHNMGKDNYNAILKEYRICLDRGLEFVNEMQGKSEYINEIEGGEIIEYDV